MPFGAASRRRVEEPSATPLPVRVVSMLSCPMDPPRSTRLPGPQRRAGSCRGSPTATPMYDLGDWRAVKISNNGWEIVPDPPILFRSFSHQKTQVEPLRCSEGEVSEVLDKLSSLINIIDENQKLLFIINLTCCFIPDIPHPIDVLHGDQGTAKTTTSTIKKGRHRDAGSNRPARRRRDLEAWQTAR